MESGADKYNVEKGSPQRPSQPIMVVTDSEDLNMKTQQASTLTFCLSCPFGQLTKKSTCPTQSF
jgi:hypothetical protein